MMEADYWKSLYDCFVVDISHMVCVQSVFLISLCLSVQLLWLVIVLTISLCCSKLFIPYLNTCEFQFFYPDFQGFLWSVTCEPHCPPFSFPWLYPFVALVLMTYSSIILQQSLFSIHSTDDIKMDLCDPSFQAADILCSLLSIQILFSLQYLDSGNLECFQTIHLIDVSLIHW